MADPFIGQLMQVAFTFPPRFWADCNGQLLSISQNTALFALIGTTYGGNGQTTFALPDLRSRSAMHIGQGPGLSNVVLGEQGGVENVTLLTTQIPIHTHVANFDGSTSTLQGTNVRATTQAPQAGSLLGRAFDNGVNGAAIPLIYAPAGSAATATLGGLNIAGTITVNPTGGSQPHTNRSPYLGIRHVIALSGIFPSRS
jgi:microcystin-dependent protein